MLNLRKTRKLLQQKPENPKSTWSPEVPPNLNELPEPETASGGGEDLQFGRNWYTFWKLSNSTKLSTILYTVLKQANSLS